jgi:hypothetical protein
MHGGNRVGAGRKIGFPAKSAEEARRYLSSRVAEDISPLADMLIEKALGGDMRALQILFDRAWGRPRQEVELISSKAKEPPSEKVMELARKLNRSTSAGGS